MVASCLLLTAVRNIWKLRRPAAGFWGRNVVPYCLMYDSSYSTVLDLLCCILCFMKLPMFSVLFSHAAALSFWSMQGLSWKDVIWMGAYVALKPGYIFQHSWYLYRCGADFKGTNVPADHHGCRLLNWVLITSQTTEQFPIWPRSILNELLPKAVIQNSHMTSSFMMEL